MWHERHEMSTREIAAATGLSEIQVKDALQSGMEKLRDGRCEVMRQLWELAEERQSDYAELPILRKTDWRAFD